MPTPSGASCPLTTTTTGSLTAGSNLPKAEQIPDLPIWSPNPFFISAEIIFGSMLHDILQMLNHQCGGESRDDSVRIWLQPGPILCWQPKPKYVPKCSLFGIYDSCFFQVI